MIDEVETFPRNAALTSLESGKTYLLDQALITLGRKLDNQLVIDDPRVSRAHAQMRAVKGQFVVFDLNSTGGTFVNGKRITQSVLYPGDVVSFGGVRMTYNQDSPPPRTDLANTVL